MEQMVTFAGCAGPSWPEVRDLLDRNGFPVQVRMIDGELSFPDESPPGHWRELRVGTPEGMVTLRREQDRVAVVTWGNADARLLQAWNALAWACAQVAGGRILAPSGTFTPEEFRRTANVPESFRVPS